jgi:lipoprotein NlpD
VTPFQLTGVWHKVEKKDTIDSIADRYGADSEALRELNDIQDNQALTGRQEVFVPKAGEGPPGTGAEPVAQRSAGQKGDSSAGVDNKTEGKCGKDGRPCLAWPVDAAVSSGFGSRDDGQHDGIDIAAPRGTKIHVAAQGQVLYSGAEIQGYGNMIIVRHEDGIITVYAHNDRNLVKEGDTLSTGQVIARVGSSGSASGTHVHFEVRIAETPRDPLLYLPSR